MPCKCGSLTHQRSNHKDCPLNSLTSASESSGSESESKSGSASESESAFESASESSSDHESENDAALPSENILNLFDEMKATHPDKKKLKEAIKVKIQILGTPAIYSIVWSLCETFCSLVHNYRHDHELPGLLLPIKKITDEIYATMISDMNFYTQVAEEMPPVKMDILKSFGELIQVCYDTTKTKAFKDAVHKVVEHSDSFLYALKLFKKNKESQDVEMFLMRYAKSLYSINMENIEVEISF